MRRTAMATVFVLMLTCASLAQAQMYCTPPVLGDVTIAEETAGFSVDATYPVLCSSPATRMLRDRVTDFLASFKLAFPEHDLSEYPRKYQATTDYSVWTAANGRLVSVKLDVSVFTGGAHPNHWPETMVFDLTDGSRIGLGDVFINPRAALTELAPTVRNVLAGTLGDMFSPEMLSRGTAPRPDNYGDFILNNQGIAFFFAPYQVAPYAAGEQAVTLPWESVLPLLRQDFLKKIRL